MSRHADDAGMTTSEYAVGTLGAVTMGIVAWKVFDEFTPVERMFLMIADSPTWFPW